MICPECDGENPEGKLVCDHCGKTIGLTSLPTGTFPQSILRKSMNQEPEPAQATKTEEHRAALDDESGILSALDKKPALLLKDRFELLEILGEDALGVSYRAKDGELGGQVMLKKFHEHLGTDPVVKKLFRLELHALRKLSHHGIITGYELYDEKDNLFFTTELPVGKSLQERMKTEKITLGRALHWFIQMMEIFQHMHEAGVLHRDVKPLNLFIDDGEKVKLGGFAMVKLIDLATITMKSQMVTSSFYQAPELLQGEQATAASDLYSAGLILAEMVKGTKLWQQENPVELVSLKSKIITDWASELGLNSDEQRNGWLLTIMPRLLHPDKAFRYSSAREVLKILQDFAIKTSSAAEKIVKETTHSVVNDDYIDEDVPCPVCNEPLLMPLAACPLCGINSHRLSEWGTGPYIVAVHPKFRKNEKGKWISKLSDNVETKHALKEVLERFYGKIDNWEKNLSTQSVMIARNVDAETADHLLKVFEAKGIKVGKLRLGSFLDKMLGAFLKIPGRAAAIFMILCLMFIPIAIMTNIVFAHYPLIIFLVAMMGFGGIGTMSLGFYFTDNELLIKKRARLLPLPIVPEQVRREYKKVSNKTMRRAARMLLVKTRSLLWNRQAKLKSEKRSADPTPHVTEEVIEKLEISCMHQLSSVPSDTTQLEAELIADMQKLDTRMEYATGEEKRKLQAASDDLLSTLNQFKELEKYRVQVNEVVFSTIERLSTLASEIEHKKELRLEKRAENVLEELLSMEIKHIPEKT